MDYTLEVLKTTIESMSKSKQIEVLGILKKHTSVRLNENNSGVFVNLSLLPENVILDLRQYVQHVEFQEKMLIPAEQQMEYFKTTFF